MSGRYAFATISLDEMAGGLERNIVTLANTLAKHRHSCSIVTFDRANAKSFYRIAKGVQWYRVGATRPHAPIGFRDRLNLILAIRRALRDARASVLVCFHHGILVRFVLATLFTRIRIVVSERNSLSLYDHIRQSKWNLNFLCLFLVKRITVQFPRYVDDYPRPLRPRIVAIPNPVPPPPPQREDDVKRQPFQLLAVGRLCAQKNYEALLEAFAGLAPRHPGWELVIVGSGEMRDRLLGEVARHGLEALVRLIPATAPISRLYRRASLFCMPSKWEGFPNALAEAMAHGLPVVGYRDCAGVGDLVAHGKTGLLAAGNGDPLSLSEALDCLMADPTRREAMGKAARKSVLRFHPDKIICQWENLLNWIEHP